MLNSASYHEDVWGSGCIAPPFLNSSLDRDEWSASSPKPRQLYPRGKRPDTHWIGGCVGPRAGLGAMELRTISCLCQVTNPCSSASSLPLYRLSLSVIFLILEKLRILQTIVYMDHKLVFPNFINYTPISGNKYRFRI
jgi:hypothetical protein